MAQPVLWREPAAVASREVRPPSPPFRFISADDSGTTPKVTVRDSRGRVWSVKFGDEVKAEVFATRFVRAVGYYAEPSYYVRSGVIRGTGKQDLGRADRHIDKYGGFREARFEWRDPGLKFLQHANWSWEKNPFGEARELDGLRVVTMLLSGWDNKDSRDNTSNTGVLRTRDGRHLYYVSDWGASMGKWGNFFTREKWDCEGFRGQTPRFVEAINNGELRFGFSGKHDGDFKKGIRIADVRWLVSRLARVSDSWIRLNLRASGASPHETSCFAQSLRQRIRQLQQISMIPAYRAHLR